MKHLLALAFIIVLGACEPSVRHEPVVVYATGEDDAELR